MSRKKSTKEKDSSKSSPPTTPSSQPPLPIQASTKSFFIVGLGSSAGGLKAVSKLLAALPVDTGMGFVLVQHLLPTRDSMSVEIFSKCTKMPVIEIQDGMMVKPNHVYMIPPNHGLIIAHRILNLTPRPEIRGRPIVIDTFFKSLAKDQKDHAIGIVLSGTGADGSEGLAEINMKGGFTFVQDPTSAEFNGMPVHAISSASVDSILSPELIAVELTRISNSKKAHPTVPPARDETHLSKIFALINQLCRVDFTLYKRTTVERRLQRRMRLHENMSLEAYSQYLSKNPNEVTTLYKDILIHVTQFFRNSKGFEVLQTTIIPQLLKGVRKEHPLRIWVPGCSTGEEVYSIALSMWLNLGKQVKKTEIKIFGTDICEESIKIARKGEYSANSLHTLPSNLDEFFTTLGSGALKVNALIRDVCLFSRHDVTRDPPFAKLDLISCQNLLIYFTPVLQKHVLQRFHYSLKPGGILWLGHSETIGECKHLFTVVDRVNKIYRKQEFSLSLGFQTLLNPRYPKKYPASSPLETLQFEGATKKEIDEVIRNEYPGVLIDEGMEIIQFYGRTAPYLEPTSGRANFNLLKMLRPQLLPDLISTFQSAKKHKASARKDNLRFEENGHSHFFNLKIIQLKPAGLPKKPRYFVVFERTAPPLNSKSGTTLSASQKLNKKRPNKNSTKQKNNSCPTNDDYQTKLDVLADELQRGKEEFQAANEEFQAANEELQSMNEELETTKEELQSGNEELSTVNEELQERSQDQSKFNNDLVNLLNTIEIPIVMLGSDLKICRFTSNINVALNLIATDVGRPIGDITSNFKSLDLKAQVSEVFSTKQSKEFELQTLQGYWYRIQIKIYSTLANSLEGAVVAFFEIDKLKRSIISTRSALAYATSVFESVAVPLVVLDQSLLFRSANESFYRYFKLDRANVEINLTELLVNEESKRSELSRALIDTIDTNTPFPDYELGFNNTEGEQRTLRLNGHNINWSDSEEPKSLLIAINDITEKKKAQETLKVHSLVLQAMADGVCIIDKNGIIIFSNLSKDAMHGYETGQLLGKHFEDFRKSREADTELCAEIKEAIKTQGQWSGELKSLKKDGSLLLTSAKISPIDISGESNWIVVQQDISLKKRVETENAQLFKREKEARLEAEKANKTKDIFLAMLSHELRTPLTAILSWAQVLRLENIDDANRLKGLKAIESNAKSQELLIDDLLDTARIQGGKIDLEVSEIDPLKILKGTLDSARLTANSKSIEIETQIDPFIGTIRADSTRIRQILSNLFTNAIKFSPRASKILVTVERIQKPVGEFIKISVADLGKGISVELLPHIFDLFVQGDSTSTRIHGGLGLGLPIARNLVRLHNGTIEAESPGEGKGSTLTVLLPALPLPTSFREATQKPEVQVEAIQKNSLKNIHILIVEDDPSMREILLYLLDCSGATAKAAESASEGFKIFREFRPDILLSDLAMPGEDGYSLISKIRALSAEQGGMTPAIALTAYAGLEDIQRTLSAGFQLHLSKPVDTFRLIEAIQKTLRSGAASSVPDNTQ